MLEKYLVQTCEKLVTTFSKRGDKVLSSAVLLSCRFREIDKFNRANHQDYADADAMLWLALNASVAEGDIIRFDGAYYQIEKINKARKLGSDTVEFIKCELTRTQVDIS